MMKPILVASALGVAAMPAALEATTLLTVETDKSVDQAMSDLEAAVTGAGATVFARIDHQKGAESVDLEMPAAQTLVFGNPKLGTPAMQSDIRAALYLPLKVAVVETEAGVVFIYEDPLDTLSHLVIPEDAEFLGKMQGALANLTEKAAN